MSKHMFHWAALMLALAGCKSGGWSVSDEVLALGQDTRIGGEFVIEVDEEGEVVSADTQVELARVPKAVMAAADKAVPGPAVDAEIEIALGVRYWEVEKQVEGRTVELVLTEDGELVGKEEELPSAKWPKQVVEAANKAVPQGQITTVEWIEGPEALGGKEYHVKKDVGGELVRISVLEDGRIGRLVRKIKAEFKAPYKR